MGPCLPPPALSTSDFWHGAHGINTACERSLINGSDYRVRGAVVPGTVINTESWGKVTSSSLELKHAIVKAVLGVLRTGVGLKEEGRPCWRIGNVKMGKSWERK